jgi:peptide/nickel transport system substrate-binding protein
LKRLLVLVLVTALVAAALVGCIQEGGDKKTPTAQNTLIIGSPAISGDFIYGFGNSSYDKWVKDLTGGYYSTYEVTPGGEFIINPTVVKDYSAVVDGAGNKTYTFEIHNDLKWNDGTPITAKDYVFNILFSASDEWVAAGAGTSAGDGLLGYSAYHSGEADRFAGVKLIDDYKFSLTIDAEELPYFFEVTYVAYGPLPMHSWCPEADIDSNDNGAMLVSDNPEWTLAFNAMRIAQIERYAPTVTCGPYNFVSFENNAVTLQKNEYFKGDWKGDKPKLEFIIIRYINQTTDVDQVINGDVDVVTGVIEGEKIEKAKVADTTDVTFYPRNGYGGIFWHCDFGPAADKNVRKAIAYLMDRQEIIKNVLGGYGSVTNGMYGLAQWMYEDNKAEIDALPNFVLNTDKANELLDLTEWKFEADGKTPFDKSKAGPDTGYYRHNAAGERLVIRHLGTEDNNVTDNIEIQLLANTPYAGIDWSVTRCDFAQLLDHYYDGYMMEDERLYHSFNLATGFSAAFDPYYSYHSDMLDRYGYNTERFSSPEVDEVTVKMRSLDPTQTEEYSALFLEFQKLFNDELPVIPLYSNQYYDIYRKEVKGFNTTPFKQWAEMICDISKGE